MSADNTIAILHTPVPEGFDGEFRVAHLQAIENYQYHICCKHNAVREYDDNCPDCNICICQHQDCWIQNARVMWDGCEIFYSMDEAMKEAQRLYKEIGYAEYGIQIIEIDRPFNKNAPIKADKEFSTPIENMEI